MCCFLAENKSFLQFSKSWPFPATKEVVCEKPVLEKKNGIHLLEKKSYFYAFPHCLIILLSTWAEKIISVKEAKTITSLDREMKLINNFVET